eukprot:2187159-Amphidinium_carterae.1
MSGASPVAPKDLTRSPTVRHNDVYSITTRVVVVVRLSFLTRRRDSVHRPQAKKASKAKAKSKKSNRKLQPLYHDSLRPPLQPMFERNVEKFGPWISRSIASVKATSRELGVTDQHCFEAQGVIGAGHHGDASE